MIEGLHNLDSLEATLRAEGVQESEEQKQQELESNAEKAQETAAVVGKMAVATAEVDVLGKETLSKEEGIAEKMTEVLDFELEDLIKKVNPQEDPEGYAIQ